MGRLKTAWKIPLKRASECDNTVTRRKDLIPIHASELYSQSGLKVQQMSCKDKQTAIDCAAHTHEWWLLHAESNQKLRRICILRYFVVLPHTFFPWVWVPYGEQDDLLCITLHNVRGWLDSNVLLHRHTHNYLRLFQDQSLAARLALVCSPEYNSHQKSDQYTVLETYVESCRNFCRQSSSSSPLCS